MTLTSISTASALSSINIDHSLFQCKNKMCIREEHKLAINIMYENITSTLLKSTDFLLKKPKHRQYQILGWNDLVKESHLQARDAFLTWRSNGSPRQGIMFDNMKNTRAHFKLSLRQCHREKTKRQADVIAKQFLSKDPKTFWKEVKNMTGNNSSPSASVIDGACGGEAICNMWHTHFSNLLNSSLDYSNKDKMLGALDDISDMNVEKFTVSDIANAVKQVKKGKASGPDGISGEHIVYSDKRIIVLLCMLFNTMLTHAYLPSNFMLSFIVPLIKDKKGDVTSKDNYRPIALTSIISKVFEIVILNIYSEFLKTAPNQFGYKFGLSTEVAIFSFKEIVNYYRSLSSNVYICLLDASKAFDKINHFHLFLQAIRKKLTPNHCSNTFYLVSDTVFCHKMAEQCVCLF